MGVPVKERGWHNVWHMLGYGRDHTPADFGAQHPKGTGTGTWLGRVFGFGGGGGGGGVKKKAAVGGGGILSRLWPFGKVHEPTTMEKVRDAAAAATAAATAGTTGLFSSSPAPAPAATSASSFLESVRDAVSSFGDKIMPAASSSSSSATSSSGSTVGSAAKSAAKTAAAGTVLKKLVKGGDNDEDEDQAAADKQHKHEKGFFSNLFSQEPEHEPTMWEKIKGTAGGEEASSSGGGGWWGREDEHAKLEKKKEKEGGGSWTSRWFGAEQAHPHAEHHDSESSEKGGMFQKVKDRLREASATDKETDGGGVGVGDAVKKTAKGAAAAAAAKKAAEALTSSKGGEEHKHQQHEAEAKPGFWSWLWGPSSPRASKRELSSEGVQWWD